MDICKNTELPRKDRKFCLGSSIAEVFEKMVEVTKTGNRAQSHIIFQFWRTTNDQNQTYCTLKLNCVNKQIKSRVDYAEVFDTNDHRSNPASDAELQLKVSDYQNNHWTTNQDNHSEVIIKSPFSDPSINNHCPPASQGAQRKIPKARSVVTIIINAVPPIHLRSRDNSWTHDQPSEENTKEHQSRGYNTANVYSSVITESR